MEIGYETDDLPKDATHERGPESDIVNADKDDFVRHVVGGENVREETIVTKRECLCDG